MSFFNPFKSKPTEIDTNVKSVDFLAYQKAKKYVPQIKAAMIALDQCYKILIPHRNFIFVLKLLEDLYDAQMVLNSHLIRHTKVLEKKGIDETQR